MVRAANVLAVVALTGLSLVGCGRYDYIDTPSIHVIPYPTVTNVVRPGGTTTPGVQQHAVRLPSAKSGSGAFDIYNVALLRQTNCSITEYLGAQTTTTSGTVAFATVPNFQTILHSNAGLTTTAGTWPNGCADQELGINSRTGVDLGAARDGMSRIAAFIDYNNNLYVGTANLSTGAFSMTELLTGSAVSLIAADVNGDGYPDLLVQTFTTGGTSSPVTVYRSNGNGTFTAGAQLFTGVSTAAFTADDINGDGKIDLVATTTNSVIVLPGNGDGTFGAGITTATAGSASAYLATGDFNGDGKKDVVLGTGAILLGDGAGHFTAAPSSPITVTGPPLVGDWNNDGKQDLAFESGGEGGGVLTTYLGNGDGTFTLGKSYATIAEATYLSTADLDGDGIADLYVGQANGGTYGPDYNSGGALQVVMGTGNDSFADAEAFPNATNGTTAAAPQAFATASFRGTAYPDVLMLSDTGLQLLTNDGVGLFTQAAVLPGTVPVAVATADMNADGKSDAIFAENNSGTYDVAVALGNGDGTFQTKTTTTVPILPARIVVGDFNGDGKPDVAVSAAAGNTVYVLLNTGNGTLGAPTLVSTEANPVTGLAAASLRGNGKVDLILTEAQQFSPTTAGAIGVLLGNGNGTFQAETHIALNYMPLALAVGDMNKDGKPDLVVASSDQGQDATSLYVLPGHGDGTFGTATSTALNFAYVTALSIADIDGDGNPDAVVASCCGATFTSIAFGAGNGTFSEVDTLPLAGSSNSIGAVDVNGDGIPDLLVETDLSHSALVVILSQHGSQSSLASTTTTLTASAASIATGGSVTFTATVASGTGTPTGTVTFLDGSTTLGTATLVAGMASYTATSLAAGSHSITASYAGDSGHTASTSSSLTETVGAGAFTLSLSPTSLTVGNPGSGTVTVTATPSGGFSQAISFSCSGLPSGATCSFSPATVTPSGAPATTTLTLATGGSSAAALFASLFLLPWGLTTRRRHTRRGVLALTALLGSIALIGGCGGGSGHSASSSSGPSTVTVTATAGSITQTATLHLTVN